MAGCPNQARSRHEYFYVVHLPGFVLLSFRSSVIPKGTAGLGAIKNLIVLMLSAYWENLTLTHSRLIGAHLADRILQPYKNRAGNDVVTDVEFGDELDLCKCADIPYRAAGSPRPETSGMHNGKLARCHEWGTRANRDYYQRARKYILLR